ncbi:AAA-like domain-containing protein [Nostoc sp. WHI]|uniref:AAA-like domain-containing protein n=1 Tax=Nostoc sp. WHI TaxID=2650611 RepID=UPI001E2FEF98|nr:AAA-like domain-containing protein [Nostoc sp. WHI]
MNIEEALAILDTFLEHGLEHGLSDVQEVIFRKAWEGQTYPDIAESCGYDANYIKDVGSKLWKLLSQAFAEEVTKSNFRSVLRRRAQSSVLSEKRQSVLVGLGQSQQTIRVKNRISESSLMTEKLDERETPVPNADLLEIPGGSVPLNSIFYIERPPIEERTYTEINKPGSLIRIKAPSRMGKSSLMHRILAHAKQTGVHTVQISLQRADSQVFTSLEKFLRWFCANVSRQLKLDIKLDDYWDEDIGSKVSCTLYLQEYLLEKIDAPVVLALDEVNRIFEYPQISNVRKN